MNKRIAIAGVLAAGYLACAQAMAQWELDSEHSSINFISVKNAAIAETHSFDSLVGYVGKSGNVQLTIDLASVETLIPIRNERMRDMLFKTVEFPSASIAAEVDPAILAEVDKGGTVSTEVPVRLSLHGVDDDLTVPVTVFSDGGSLSVVSSRPVIINAADFGLAGGVEALRKVAGLNSISTAVPVTLNLHFSHAP
ncbi:YceI family protein [Seongchinamella sediminis]|nr:YceI family protein [Seongchinamella sediminis]